jgi:magnesium and cobalt exporter, CNNM family
LGGLMMAFLDRIPRSGDHFDWGGFRFEVVDMDGHRVDKVLIKPLAAETPPLLEE